MGAPRPVRIGIGLTDLKRPEPSGGQPSRVWPVRRGKASIQNKPEPASNNNGLHCQSAVAVAIGAKGLSGALSNAADPELVLPMEAAACHRPSRPYSGQFSTTCANVARLAPSRFIRQMAV